MDIKHIAATVIARARDEYGQGAAAFDYAIASDDPNAWRWINNVVYNLANEHLPAITPGVGQTELDTRVANAARLREQLSAELDTYTARCRSREYVGWSDASRGPIRYAD